MAMAPATSLAQSPPLNDNFTDRIPLSGAPVHVTGSNVEATREFDEPYHADNAGGSSVWWSWTAPAAGGATVTTSGSDFDTVLAVYLGDTLPDLVPLEGNDDDPISGTLTSRVVFNVEAGTTYQIAVDGFSDGLAAADAGDVVLNISLGARIPAPPNDAFTNATLIDGAASLVQGTNVGATREPGEPDHAGNLGGKSVWWWWTAPSSDVVTVTTEGSGFDTLLAAYTGATVGTLTPIASDDDGGPARTSQITFTTTAGTPYRIAVDGYHGASGRITLRIRVGVPTAPGWELLDVCGNPLRSLDFAGHVVLLNFWATWCGPCVQEIPDLIALQDQYREDGLVVIGLSVDRNGAALVSQFMAEHGINYPVALASDPVIADYGGIEFIPSSFIIDRNNRIAAEMVGSRSQAVFEAAVLPLLRDVQPRIRRVGEETGVSWPAAQSGFVLESTASLSSPLWQEVPGPFPESEGWLTFSPPTGSACQFYRLRK